MRHTDMLQETKIIVFTFISFLIHIIHISSILVVGHDSYFHAHEVAKGIMVTCDLAELLDV